MSLSWCRAPCVSAGREPPESGEGRPGTAHGRSPVQLELTPSHGPWPRPYPMPSTPYKQLEQEWQRLHAFAGALSLLRWDAAVMMPRGSADVRGEQLAAIETEQHALLTSPKVSRLLERAQAGVAELDDW